MLGRPFLMVRATALLSLSLLLLPGMAHALCARSAGTPDDGTTACAPAAPICVQGACIACGGDFGSGTAAACPTSAAPFCTSSGTCGLGCEKDTDCKPTAFCDPLTLACTAKLPDGTHLPAGDTCDAVTAKRECATSVCDPATNLCGPVKVAAATDAGPDGNTIGIANDAGVPDALVATYTPGGGCSVTGAQPATALLVAATALSLVLARRRRRRRAG